MLQSYGPIELFTGPNSQDAEYMIALIDTNTPPD